MNYKEALKEGFFELQSARDWYREMTTTPVDASSSSATSSVGMHAELVEMYIKTAALLVQPIAPHFAEHIWSTILGQPESIQKARWADIPVISSSLLSSTSAAQSGKEMKMMEEELVIAVDAGAYMRAAVKNVRDAEITLARKSKKGAAAATGSGKKAVRLIVATSFPPWQDACITVVKEVLDGGKKDASDLDEAKLKSALTAKGLLKDKRVMPFVQALKVRSFSLRS